MRFLFLVLAVVWMWLLVRRIVSVALRYLSGPSDQYKKAQNANASIGEATRLVRDPECGLYIPEARAFPLKSGSGIAHFCSATCRDRYFDRQQKLAASA